MNHRGRHIWESLANDGAMEYWKKIDSNDVIQTVCKDRRCSKCGKIDGATYVVSATRT